MGIEIDREVAESRYLRHGRLIVGAEAIPVSDSAKIFKGLLVRAASTNSGTIYVGGSSVSAADSVTQGIPLPPGSAMEIPCDDASQVFVVADDSSQKLHWLSI
jgi:hypothetical protein